MGEFGLLALHSPHRQSVGRFKTVTVFEENKRNYQPTKPNENRHGENPTE